MKPMLQFDGDGNNRWNKSRVALVILVVLSLSLSLVTLVIYINKERASRAQSLDFCVACSIVEQRQGRSVMSKADSELRGLYTRLRKTKDRWTDEEQCCATNAAQRAELVQLFSKNIAQHPKAAPITETAMRPKMLQHVKTSPAFAQKSLIRNQQPTDRRDLYNGHMVSVLNINPDKDDNRYELSHGVRLHPDGIQIVTPGLYFAYKSINFLPDSNEPCRKLNQQTFTSRLLRFREEKRVVLVTTEHTCCPDCIHNSETDFSGGVFHLEKEDIIKVDVSEAHLVHISRDVTYIGLIMMET